MARPGKPVAWARRSRDSRLLKLARSASPMSLLLQLFFALYLFSALFLVGSSITVPAEDGTIADQYALITPALAIKAAILIGLGTIAVLIAFRALRGLIAEYRRESRVEAQRARAFLDGLERSGEEYALILRPGGAAEAPLFLPVARPFWQRYRDPAGNAVALEELVTRQIRALAGIRTVAAVDPDCELVPPGPDYIALADRDAELEALIARAHMVFVILPPARDAAPAADWEIAQLYRKGLAGRAALLLPPRRAKRNWQGEGLAEALVPEELAFERPALARQLVGDVVLVYLGEDLEFWNERSHLLGPLARTFDRTYAQVISGCLHDMLAAMPPRTARYPYFHTAMQRLKARRAKPKLSVAG